MKSNNSLSQQKLSIELHQQGKNFFEQKRYEEAIKYFYEAMMIRVQQKQDDLADNSRIALDTAISVLYPPPSLDRQTKILKNPQVPDFVRLTVGKKHSEVADIGRPNCINAIFNYFAKPPYKYETAKTDELLTFLLNDCVQIDKYEKNEGIKIAVFWSRSGGSWDHQKIVIQKMNSSDIDFPYGLVFEHIAVFVDSEIVFHKPSPAKEVPNKLDYIESVVGGFKHAKGFEITWHIKKV